MIDPNKPSGYDLEVLSELLSTAEAGLIEALCSGTASRFRRLQLTSIGADYVPPFAEFSGNPTSRSASRKCLKSLSFLKGSVEAATSTE
jgi:hypothetical protein